MYGWSNQSGPFRRASAAARIGAVASCSALLHVASSHDSFGSPANNASTRILESASVMIAAVPDDSTAQAMTNSPGGIR